MMVDPTLSENKLSIKVWIFSVILKNLDFKLGFKLLAAQSHFLRVIPCFCYGKVPKKRSWCPLLWLRTFWHSGYFVTAPRWRKSYQRKQDWRPDEELETLLKQRVDAAQSLTALPKHDWMRELYPASCWGKNNTKWRDCSSIEPVH